MTLADHPRELLRNLHCLSGPLPRFHPADSADDPVTQFLNWLEIAIAAQVAEPHAMTLSTVDEHGFSDARVLLLKNLDAEGWHFAISAVSPKGRQLAAQPKAALTFYWQKLGRQVRIRGTAVSMGPASSAAYFRARPEDSRAGALMARQSDILDDPSDLDVAFAAQRQRLAH